MERHMEIGKIKFTYREISLLGVMISAEKISPSLFSQVALIITEMRPGDSFDDDITKICLLAQQYQGIVNSEKRGVFTYPDRVPRAERPVFSTHIKQIWLKCKLVYMPVPQCAAHCPSGCQMHLHDQCNASNQ